MFGIKKSDDVGIIKACPFTFPLSLREGKVGKFGKCIQNECQLWDEERKDCGLKQK